MRVVLFGSTGLAGRELLRTLGELGEVIAPTRADIDLGRCETVEDATLALRPDILINASAQADVDRAEREHDDATAVNATSVGALGRAAARCGVPIVHLSTDYVFDGEKGSPYVETDAPRPLSHYGATKLAGEVALAATGAHAVVLRTAWIIGNSPRSFVSRMLALAETREVLEVADDQSSSPTPMPELARVVVAVARRLLESSPADRDRARGIFHAAGRGQATRVELVRAAIELSPRRTQLRVREIVPVSGNHFPRAAPRPRHTPLSTDKLRSVFETDLLPWQEGLARALRSFASQASP